MANHIQIGRWGEYAAQEYLVEKGFWLVEQNWRCRRGEIDLIMLDREELVFVEVKTRLAGLAAEQYLFSNITLAKQKRLRRLVEIFLSARYGRGPLPRHRIDVVGVQLERKRYTVCSVEHLVGVI